LSESGYSEGDIGYLAILHMKRSIHEHTLQELGLRDDQTFYLEEYGHTGQMDAPISIRLGLESGRIKDGTIVVMVAAGIGYTWGATTMRWGPANAGK
jgi:3-oxoacyl-[acyl-carrier-protein] synthase-3